MVALHKSHLLSSVSWSVTNFDFLFLFKAVVFCKVGLRTLLPEISENLNKNKNEIPVFFYSLQPKKRLRILLLSLLDLAPGHWKHDHYQQTFTRLKRRKKYQIVSTN